MQRETGVSEGWDEVACPFCGSTDSEMIALFGSQLLTSQYYCNGCRTVFEVVRHETRPEEEAEGANRGAD